VKARWRGFRSSLAAWLVRYLVYKRALGRVYDADEKVLRLLDRFLSGRKVSGAKAVTSEIVDAFLSSRPRMGAASSNNVLRTLQRFFAWLVLQGQLELSPVRAGPRRDVAKRIPFLMELAESRRLLDAAGQLRDTSNARHRAHVYRTAFALMATLGLRVREVSRLCRGDVDLRREILLIRESKFGKSRLVPFGARMAELLRRYLALDAPDGETSIDAPLFTFRNGRPINPSTISHTFTKLVRSLKLEPRPGVASPRAHDLRHVFAVRTLLRWYRGGVDPSKRLFHLATFLGHVNPLSTAWYLTITDELLDEAGRRFERYGSPSWNEAR
jgi:integrase